MAGEAAGMSALDALRAGLRTLSREPATIAPHYLLAVGVTFGARAPLLLGGGLALLLLRWQGRIGPIVRRLGEVDWQASHSSVPPALREAIRGLVTPGTVLIVLLSLLASVMLLALARGIAGAATLNALSAGVEDRDPLREGTVGIGEDWLSFVTLAVVRGGLLVGAGCITLFALGLTATVFGAIVGVPLLLVTVLLTALALLLVAFAGPAVAVDDVGAVGALGASLRFPLRQPVAFLLYAVVAAVVVVATLVCAAVCNLVGIPRVTALLVLLGVNPLLDAAKVGLYTERKAGVESAASAQGSATGSRGSAAEADESAANTEEREWKFPVEESTDTTESESAETVAENSEATSTPRPRTRIVAGFGRGLRELRGFVRMRPLLVLAGVATLLVGIGLGWGLTAPYGTRLSPPADVAAVFGAVPVTPFVNIAANNWLVAVAQGFGGVGLGVPTVVNLLFNGVLIGGLAGMFDLTVFVALVAPHGVVEVPALGVAGGLGYHLAGVAYRALRGRIEAETVAEELQRAAWIVVGLVPLFVLAAFIEAFVTPQIAAAVLGG